LIDGVYSRDAGDGKDMAFGVWAVLQRYARFSLPAPDYEQSPEGIYTTFSQLLVRIKGTSYLLLLAALKNVEGEPSWVPDWAAGSSHDWRSWGNAEMISRKTQISDNMFPASETARTVFLIPGSRGMGLSIRGRRLDTVIACSAFQPTKSSYDEGERQIYIDNLILLLRLELTQASWEDFYVDMRDVVRKDHFMYWIHHSRGHRERRPAALLSSLLADHSGKHPIALYTGGGHFMLMISPRVTSSDILLAQIDMCNELARQKQAIFDASNIAWSSTYTAPWRGWCNPNVQVGDVVVLFEKVPVPLIVRACSSESDAVRIISPAMTGRRLDWEIGEKGIKFGWRSGPMIGPVEDFNVF
jgi:hypothetical protein